MITIYAGDIGEPLKRIRLDPLEEPAPQEAPLPEPVTEPAIAEPVPA